MFINILVICILIIMDQISKLLVVIKMNENKSHTVIPRYLKITSIRNRGAALGILEGQRNLFIIISFVVLIVFTYLLINEKTFYNSLTYIFIISGTVGNLLDRIIRKEVVDFIDITIFRINFPIFNFADFYLFLGIINLMISEIY